MSVNDNMEVNIMEYEKAVNYRLDNIEKVLNELKDVMIENKMQARDILELGKKVEENNNAINAHDKRIRQLEVAPVKDKADKWEHTLKIIAEFALTSCLVIVAFKIGLK